MSQNLHKHNFIPKTLHPKNCMKALINTTFQYIFLKPNWLGASWPPYITQMYLINRPGVPGGVARAVLQSLKGPEILTPPVTCDVSRVACHMSYVFFF